MTRAVYLVGLPGAGKSTAVRRALAACSRVDFRDGPEGAVLPHAVFSDSVTGLPVAVELGAPHPTFPGTDRLSMAVEPKARRWVPWCAHAWAGIPLVAEGDRLATAGFFDVLRAHYDLVVVHVAATDVVAEERRLQRAGSTPPDSWVRGRATKVRNLVDRYGALVVEVDATLPPDEIARFLRARLDGESLVD